MRVNCARERVSESVARLMEDESENECRSEVKGAGRDESQQLEEDSRSGLAWIGWLCLESNPMGKCAGSCLPPVSTFPTRGRLQSPAGQVACRLKPAEVACFRP